MPSTLTNTVNTGSSALTTAIGGAAPTSGDSLYITEEAVDYTSAIDYTAIDLAKLVVGGKYKKNIGASGSPMIVGVSSGATAIAIFSWAGQYAYIKAGATVGLIDRLEVRPSAGGKVTVVGDTVTDLYAFSGACVFTDVATCTNAYLKGGSTFFMLASSATAVVILDARGMAVVTLERDVTTLTIAENATVTVSSTTCTPTTINSHGGTLQYAGGNIGTLTSYGGTLDFSQAKADIVVTTATVHEGTRIIPPGSGVSITFTNPVTYIGQNVQRFPGT